MWDFIIGIVSNTTSHFFIKFFERKSEVPENSNDKSMIIKGNLMKNCNTAITIKGNCNNFSITDNIAIGCNKVLDIDGENHQDINIKNNILIK